MLEISSLGVAMVLLGVVTDGELGGELTELVDEMLLDSED